MNETIPGEGGAAGGATARDLGLAGLLDSAREIAETVLRPRANATDRAGAPPVDNVRLLADAGLLGLTTPVQYGGHGAPGHVVRRYTEILAAACGVTTFVQGQHLSACALITGGENEELREGLLPAYAGGERLIGVSFAHLRRPGPPTMRVRPEAGGYRFDGYAPWFTGWGVMDDVVLGGTLPDGRLLYTVVALTQGEALHATAPMRLCAMDSSGTVTLKCRELFVPRERAMKTITAAQMAANDLGAILGLMPQIFGATVAAIGIVRGLADARRSDLLDQTADALEAELQAARCEAEAWRDRTDDDAYKDQALRIRAWCIELGVRAAHAAVTATGGGANSLDNDAQRIFREAMFYTLVAQTRDVQTATLRRLAASAARGL